MNACALTSAAVPVCVVAPEKLRVVKHPMPDFVLSLCVLSLSVLSFCVLSSGVLNSFVLSLFVASLSFQSEPGSLVSLPSLSYPAA